MANGLRRPIGVQLLQQPSLGESIGSGFGAGLSQGLQSLLEQKSQQMQQRQASSGFEELAKMTGQQISSEQAQALASLPPQVQQIFAKQLMQAPQQQQFGNIINSLLNDDAPQTPGVQNVEGNVEVDQGADRSPQLNMTGFNEKQVMDIVKTKQGQQKIDQIRDKEIKKDLDEALKIKRDTTQRLNTLDEITRLNKEGKLDHPAVVTALSSLGLEWALTPESQQYLALEKEFLGDLKTIFGGRITDREMTTFLRSIPRLVNSEKGRQLIADAMRLKYQAQGLRADIMKDVLRKNPKINPLDFSLKVDDLFTKKQEKLANKINNKLKESNEIGNQVRLSEVPVGQEFKVGGKIYEMGPGGERIYKRSA